jgi:hypothetical protein
MNSNVEKNRWIETRDIRAQLYTVNGAMLVNALGLFVFGIIILAVGHDHGNKVGILGFISQLVMSAIYIVYGFVNYLNVWSEIIFLMMFWQVLTTGLLGFAIAYFVHDITLAWHICDEISCNGIMTEIYWIYLLFVTFQVVLMFVNFFGALQIINLSFDHSRERLFDHTTSAFTSLREDPDDTKIQ